MSVSPRRSVVRAWLSALLAIAVSLTTLGVVALAPAVAETTGPTIASDQADYPPGGLVTLTGDGWLAGEAVHIVVNDDQGRTWERSSDVTADDTGAIVDVFNLPDWFVATYAVMATGEVSGVARTSFTDGNLKVDTAAPTPVTASVKRTIYTGSTNCSSGAGGTEVVVANSTGVTIGGIGASDSVLLEAPSPVVINGNAHTFQSWTVGSTLLATTMSACVVGTNGNKTATANYGAGVSTSTATSVALTNSANPSTYGSAVTFTAAVSPAQAPGTVTFFDGTTRLCTAVSLTNGSAQCSTSALTAGNHAVTAGYNGATGYNASTSSVLTQVVQRKEVTGSFTASNKAYDGTTAATIATRSLAAAGIVGTDDVSLTGGTATFATPAVGNGKTVTATGFTLDGTAAGNYTLAAGPWTTSADITALGVVVGFTASHKTYDGTTAAEITTRSLSGVREGDTVTISGGNAAFSSKTAGNGKAVNASGFTLGGAQGGNYSITSVTPTTATIHPKHVTGSFTAQDKTYDGTVAAQVTARSPGAVVDGDAVSLSGGTATFADKNAGADKVVTLAGAELAGADAGNYVLDGVDTAGADINRRDVTGVFTTSSKVYDGNRDASASDRDVVGEIDGDAVTLTGGSASFDTKQVGTGKTVTLSDATLAGVDAPNYRLTGVGTQTADITVRHVTGSFTVADKEYDRTTAAAVTGRTLVNAVEGDKVSLTGGTATFADRNAGDDQIVTLNGYDLDGDDAGNYVLDSVADAKADISEKPVTGSFTAGNKVYDGDTDAEVLSRDAHGVIDGDTATLTGGTATFANARVGNGKVVTLSGATLEGADASNYALGTVATTTADISALGLKVTFEVADKEYDGTTDATITDRKVDGVLDGDVVTVDEGTATFEGKDAGEDKKVTASGFELGGAQAGNYSVTAVNDTTATISRKEITGSFTAADRDYDGTDAATVQSRTPNGIVGQDEVTLDGGSATFANKNAGAGKVVTLAGATLAGADAANYELTSVGTTSATIRRLQVSGTFTAEDKPYDGNSDAVVESADVPAKIDGDNLTLEIDSAAFENERAGTGKKVTALDYALTGDDAANYDLTGVDDATADITQLGLTGSFKTADKFYDATTTATATDRAVTGVVGDDVVTLVGGSAHFADKNVGTNKVVALSGATLSGADADNYTLGSVTPERAAITPLGITGSFTTADKEYDGTTAAEANARSLSGVLGTDDVDLDGGVANFDDKNVGTGKSVVLSGYGLVGNDAGNYTVSVGKQSAAITAKTINGSFAAANKVYDGNRTATVTAHFVSGQVSGDDVALTGDTATFDDKLVGTGKTVTLHDGALVGSDKGNYNLSLATARANITALEITGSFTAGDKTYDGNDSATVLTRSLHDVVQDDKVTLVGGSASFEDADTGQDKSVTLTGAELDGDDALNYTLKSVGTTTADIFRKDVTGSFAADDKVYDGSVSATVANRALQGVLTADDGEVALVIATATFADKNVGDDKAVTANGPSLTGSKSHNYDLTGVSETTADIRPKSITGSFAADDKVYDGSVAASVTNRSLTGAVSGDDVDLNGGTATFADKNVEVGKTVTLAGADLIGTDKGNYTLSGVSTTTASITAKSITGSFTADNKVYDGNVAATVLTGDLRGAVDGDKVWLAIGSASFGDKNVGNGKTVTASNPSLTGADAANYLLTSVATTTANITRLAITGSFTSANKVYDGTTDAASSGRTLHGFVPGDNVSLTGGTAAFDSKNVGVDKTVTLSGHQLSGTDAGNYTLASVATTNANITRLAITGSFTSANKVYDGTSDAASSGRTLHGFVAGDDVGLAGGTAAFGSKDAGDGKTVTLTGAQLTGNDAGNYTLTGVATTKADITRLAITGSFASANKVYDGTTDAASSGRALHGFVAGDDVRLSGGTAAFGTKNVGTDKTVTLTGAGLSGADAGNYTLASVATTKADITRLAITGSFTSSDKVYDGTTHAASSGRTLHGFVPGDNVSLTGGTAAFDSKDVGTDKTVTLASAALSGADAVNYELTSVGTTMASITPKGVVVTASSPGTLLLGSPTPVITPEYAGFIEGEGVGQLSTPSTCSTAYTPSSSVGPYSTSCAGATAQNYSFSYVPGSIQVVYGWNGFLQPINDTAHQLGVQLSQFKLGSTVPAKFVLKNAAGQVVVASTAPTFKAARLSGCAGELAIAEDQAVATPDSGNSFKWDGSKYQYNWSTKGLQAGLYRVRAITGDGSPLTYVDICLAK